jgi:hypothetical protein
MTRRDNRNLQQFKQDIKISHKIELELMTIYVNWLNSAKGGGYSFKNYGVDNSGKFIPNDREVSLNADFLLCRDSFSDRKIEIKFCREDYNEFHLKVHQINDYIKEDVCVVNFMGINTNKKRFCILTPTTLKEALNKGPIVTKWSKPCLRFKCKDFAWIECNV